MILKTEHLISIVGAGPGDPDLMTVKAARRLSEADVVLNDALIGAEILELAPQAKKIYVGKWCSDNQDQEQRQITINQKMLFFAQQGKKVVRLKTGDPMIFGRGAEEIQFCADNQLNFEVIPGITAGLAAASLCNIPLTLRKVNSSVLFCTGHLENGHFTDVVPISLALINNSPVVLYMGKKNMVELSVQLIKKGVSPVVPVQILSRVSQQGQEIYSSQLGILDRFFESNNPATPTLVIIGNYTQPINRVNNNIC